MDIVKHLEKMKKIQVDLLNFLENEENQDDDLTIEKDFFDELKIIDNKHEFKLFLYLLSKIYKNHNRTVTFSRKIHHILKFFKNDIKKYFSNTEIFHIFKKTKKCFYF